MTFWISFDNVDAVVVPDILKEATGKKYYASEIALDSFGHYIFLFHCKRSKKIISEIKKELYSEAVSVP